MLGFGKKQPAAMPNMQPAPAQNVSAQAIPAQQPSPQPAQPGAPLQQQPTAPNGTKPNGKQPLAKPVNPFQKFGPGSVSLVDLIAPSAVEVDFRHIRVGDKYHRTFFVVDYPREVSPNWLSILIDYKETMNVSMYIYPVESKDILTNLRRKIAEMEATIDSDAKTGMDPDPKLQAALEDAIALREELARGLERFFQFGLYITLTADTIEQLNEKSSQLSTLLASNMMIVKPTTLQMENGYKTTLPFGHDKIYLTRNMDTTSVASTFPFTSYEISQPNGILYGVNTLNNSLVIVDRFSFENANQVVFGKSGSGKSFTVKLEILRQMMFDAEILIIDPEDEYKTLCHALDGEYINFSKNSEVKLNPFALLAEDMSDAQLGIKILSLHGLLKTMVGDISPTQEAILDRALVLVYKQKGITPDPTTYKNEPPILEDLYKTLLNMEEADAKDLAFRLEKYVKGGFSGLFNHQTNYDVRNQLTVFSIKQLEDALRPIAMHTILDFIWSRVRTKLKKRILVVDEAWYLMKYPDSASFLQGICKRARKYFLGVTTLTQDIEDFLNNDYGKAIVSNSSIQILLKQNTAEVEALAKAFMLSEGEKQYLLTAQVGEGLLFAGQNHISAQFLSSQFEYELISSKPQDVMAQEEQNAQFEQAVATTAEPTIESSTVTSTILETPNADQDPPQADPTTIPAIETSETVAPASPPITPDPAIQPLTDITTAPETSPPPQSPPPSTDQGTAMQIPQPQTPSPTDPGVPIQTPQPVQSAPEPQQSTPVSATVEVSVPTPTQPATNTSLNQSTPSSTAPAPMQPYPIATPSQTNSAEPQPTVATPTMSAPIQQSPAATIMNGTPNATTPQPGTGTTTGSTPSQPLPPQSPPPGSLNQQTTNPGVTNG